MATEFYCYMGLSGNPTCITDIQQSNLWKKLQNKWKKIKSVSNCEKKFMSTYGKSLIKDVGSHVASAPECRNVTAVGCKLTKAWTCKGKIISEENMKKIAKTSGIPATFAFDCNF